MDDAFVLHVAGYAPSHAITLAMLTSQPPWAPHSYIEHWSPARAFPSTPELVGDLVNAGREDLAAVIAGAARRHAWADQHATNGPTLEVRLAAIRQASVSLPALAALTSDPLPAVATAAAKALASDLDARPYHGTGDFARHASNALLASRFSDARTHIEAIAAMGERSTSIARLTLACLNGRPITGSDRQFVTSVAGTCIDPAVGADLVHALTAGSSLAQVTRDMSPHGEIALRAHQIIWKTGTRQPVYLNNVSLLASPDKLRRSVEYLLSHWTYDPAGGPEYETLAVLAHPLLPTGLIDRIVTKAVSNAGTGWFRATCDNPCLTREHRLALVEAASVTTLPRAIGWESTGRHPDVVAAAIAKARANPRALGYLLSAADLPVSSYQWLPDREVVDAFDAAREPVPADWAGAHLRAVLGSNAGAWLTFAGLAPEWSGSILELAQAARALG